MPSNIDPTVPVDGAPASKAELRANLETIRTEVNHGGFAEGLVPTGYGPTTSTRVLDHLIAIDEALGAGAGTSAPAPSPAVAQPGTHALAVSERADANVLLVVETATDLEIPADATAGSIWLVDLATEDPVTVSVAGDAGLVNGLPGGAVHAVGEGSLVIWVRGNADGTAPSVRVAGEIQGGRALAGDLDAAGFVISGYADGTDVGDLTGAVLTAADRGRVKVHTGGAGTLVVPDIGDGSVDVINDGSGTLSLAAGDGLLLQGDTAVLQGVSARIRLFTGAGGVRKVRVGSA